MVTATLKRSSPYILALLALFGVQQGQWWTLSGVFILFALHPLLDWFMARDPHMPEQLSNGTLNLLTLLYVPFQLFFLLYCGQKILQSESMLEMIGITFTCGVLTGGLGITVAHELVHRTNPRERAGGIFLLMMVNYAHFRVEHVFGHHRHVATPKDPATSRLNQSVYQFLPQSLVGSWLSAFAIDWKRAKDQTLMLQVLSNRTLQYLAVSIAISSFMAGTSNWTLLLFWWGQSAIAVLLLEIINYIEHYGLERKISVDGIEAVTPQHSWDCTFKLTNLTLFNLGRHSHHHAQASVPYWNLKNSVNVPELPMGYSSAILLALMPPLWKKVMNPLVLKVRQLQT